ncbi:MAG: DUF1028 domain-containing protein [Pseudomonadota bacterium]
MTYSIIAREPATEELGVAVASRFFAVGAMVPHVRGGKGAVATQAAVNPLWGLDAADRMAQGEVPGDILADLVACDDGAVVRQIHMIDAAGRHAAHTGADCVDWCGDAAADNVSVAGNMLVGEGVVADTLATYVAHPELSLAERLMLAMEAGAAAGGDKRGTQSAALVIHLRGRIVHFMDYAPTRANPSAQVDRAALEARIEEADAKRFAAGVKSRSFATP